MGKNKYSREEIDLLHERVDFSFKEAGCTKWKDEAESMQTQNKALAGIAIQQAGSSAQPKLMSEEEWNFEHGLRADGSKRRGPAKKPKPKFYEIEPGQFGTSEEPAERMDLDSIEAAIEVRMMEESIEEQKQKPATHVGKRLRKPHQQQIRRPQSQNFWI